ncbi:iron-containing alcohol dehydrogenase [Jatrophihabitans cynanchi]|uniref:Iron-containing alcohol dehydrogenase n=2 Tax=Jatrophihabitans cynanchi TaxID=2944128 RepID=A0ABY7K458_9ACTN|nr:iron-containing alcohol dehydrogenase [Jatrophihabitans sp. SB3-54]WAX59283.1 iron-containing alcohol dehydrogenase [Jatrophihabitans sp. SB3-54]
MHLPAHVAHGDGSVSDLSELLRRWGVAGRTAFVVSDRFLIDRGLADGLLGSLQSSGWRVEVFAEPAGEPTLSDAVEVVEAARGSGADVVVGFGGGSVLDLAKVVALLLANRGDIADHLSATERLKPAKPLVLVPTTAGTGAEATRVAVLSDGVRKHVLSHPSLVPLGVVLDAAVIADLPPHITAATGMDALAHAVESSLSTSSTPLTASMGLRAATLLMHWLPVAYRDSGNLEARRATLYGAFLAGIALNAGVVVGHSMAYTVANRSKLAHGVTCAMALPFCVAFNAAAASPDLLFLGAVISGASPGHFAGAAAAIAELAASFGIPSTPLAAGISEAESAAMAHECTTVYPRPTNPVPMASSAVQALYAAWFRGDLEAAARAAELSN